MLYVAFISNFRLCCRLQYGAYSHTNPNMELLLKAGMKPSVVYFWEFPYMSAPQKHFPSVVLSCQPLFYSRRQEMIAPQHHPRTHTRTQQQTN